MKSLTYEENKSYKKQKVCYICKKVISTNDKNKGAAHDICNLRYKTPKEIPVIFHNCSTYDYHFITKDLAEEFEGQFECLGENTEKYITFSVPIKKGLDNGKSITYKIQFIDSFRFMSSSSPSLADNLS